MRTNTMTKLEFNRILEQLSELAVSQKAKERLLELRPFLDERLCKQKQNETTEALKILETFGSPPLSPMKELDKILELAEKGSMLVPEQFGSVVGFLTACKRMKGYLKKAQEQDIPLGYYVGSFQEFEELYGEIDRSIRGDRVEDSATPALRDIRRRIENANAAIKAKLDSILRSHKEWFADGYVATRNGRLVLPVKKEYKNQIQGTVVDTSGTGGTCFIEPTAVRKLHDELSGLQIDEDNEVRKVLYTLTALVEENLGALRINMDCMEILDFAFAKAKLSHEMKAIPAPISPERSLKIVEGRHPLLKAETCVPLNFEVGGPVRGVVITGPNTGGKTVALKTVGLLSLMAQSGLHVPAAEGSVFCMRNAVLCDIGDGQSITENLSTFSAHITNIIEILGEVTEESLVLLDELGSGTDPAEGMGIAAAILEELRQRGCLFVATTHYPEIKEYAEESEGLVNARMEFDRESLKPLYRLEIGEAGESCALYIAQRLGFPPHLLNRARKEAYRHSAAVPDMPVTAEPDETASFHAKPSAARIRKEVPKADKPLRSESFSIGDSVMVYPQREVGIVCRRADERGELGVQVKKEKRTVNHKRLKLISPASELYPEDYDFSIVFDTVANRKARHQMGKRHDPNAVIEYEE